MTRREGRWRHSKKANKIGSVAVILEGLVCRDNYTFDEAYEILTANHNIPIGKTEAYNILCQLPSRNVRPLKKDVGEEPLLNIPQKDALPDEMLINKEFGYKKSKLLAIVRGISRSLSDEDRLILKMRFEDDIKISEIAKVLRKNRNMIDRSIKSIFIEFKEKILSTSCFNENDAIEVIRFIEKSGEDYV